MPANARPSTLQMSSSMIFQSEPRLSRSVSQASGSSSTAAAWVNPACSSPRDAPPAPAQISRQVSSPTVPPTLGPCPIVPVGSSAPGDPTPIDAVTDASPQLPQLSLSPPSCLSTAEVQPCQL